MWQRSPFLLVVMLLLALPTTSNAGELFLDGALGTAFHTRTTPDGIWWQQPFPHSFDLTSRAYRAGLGLQVTEHWAITASYVNLGKTRATTEYVEDDDYNHGRLSGPRQKLVTTDYLSGPQITGTYRWTNWTLQPFLSGGVALLHHTGVAINPRAPEERFQFHFHGDVPMLVAEGGICYKWICGDVTYYRGVHSPNYPISTEAIVSMIGVKVPLPF